MGGVHTGRWRSALLLLLMEEIYSDKNNAISLRTNMVLMVLSPSSSRLRVTSGVVVLHERVTQHYGGVGGKDV